MSDAGLSESNRELRRGAPWLLFVFSLLLFAPLRADAQLYEAIGRGDLSEEDLNSIQAIINDFGFTDVAEVWVDARLGNRPSTAARPELEWFRVDIMRRNGLLDEAATLNAELAKKYPNHRRAKGVEIEAVLTAMANLALQTLNAQYETDPASRQQILRERDQNFQTNVMAVLETNIATLNQSVERDPNDLDLVNQRDRWEHLRIKAAKQYAEMLLGGGPKANEWYGKLVEYADEFVNERYENLAMQYEAQLMLGQGYAALGQSEDAANTLELIIEFEPTTDPPYDEVQVYFSRFLRIQGLQGTMEAWNRAGQPEMAIEVIDNVIDHPDFPWHADPEDPDLMRFVVAMDIEEAIARINGGDRDRGIALMRTMLDKFDSDAYRSGDPDGADAYLEAIGVGLSRAIQEGAIDLPPEFLYRGALGFKRQGDFNGAIRAGQLTLDGGGGVRGEEFWVASALYEIGDAYDSLGMAGSAAAAFQTLSTQFANKSRDKKYEALLANSAQNWYAISGDLAESLGGPWVEIVEWAEEVFSQLSRGEAGITLRLQEAREKEDRGLYADAKKIYEGIPRTIEVDGETTTVAAYYRALAGAGRCEFRQADSEGRAKDARRGVVERLERLLDKAKQDGDASGQASIIFEIASIHWDDDIRDREAALKSLAPLTTSVQGKNPYREGGLRMIVSVATWTNPDDASDAAQPEKAEAALTALKSSFGDSASTAISLYELSQAYELVGTEAASKRAGELVLDYMKHPVAKIDEAGPGVLLGLAETLIAAGFSREASDILKTADGMAQQDPALRIVIVFLRAKAGNLAKQYSDVLSALESFMEEYSGETFQGDYEEAPYILYQYALAHLGQRERDRDVSHLDNAFRYLEGAVAIMKQRIQSFIINGKPVPAKFEKEYWSVTLQYLLVMKEQDRCEIVKKYIRAERVMKGNKPFAPPALQAQFDQLERDCQ